MTCDTSDNVCQYVQNWCYCFIGNVIIVIDVRLTNIFSIQVSSLILTISQGEIKGNKNYRWKIIIGMIHLYNSYMLSLLLFHFQSFFYTIVEKYDFTNVFDMNKNVKYLYVFVSSDATIAVDLTSGYMIIFVVRSVDHIFCLVFIHLLFY